MCFVNNVAQPPQNFADGFPDPLSGCVSRIALPRGKAGIIISIWKMRNVASGEFKNWSSREVAALLAPVLCPTYPQVVYMSGGGGHLAGLLFPFCKFYFGDLIPSGLKSST